MDLIIECWQWGYARCRGIRKAGTAAAGASQELPHVSPPSSLLGTGSPPGHRGAKTPAQGFTAERGQSWGVNRDLNDVSLRVTKAHTYVNAS